MSTYKPKKRGGLSACRYLALSPKSKLGPARATLRRALKDAKGIVPAWGEGKKSAIVRVCPTASPRVVMVCERVVGPKTRGPRGNLRGGKVTHVCKRAKVNKLPWEK